MLILDTNTVIALMDSKQYRVRERYRAARRASEPFAFSSIVLFELHYGIENSRQTVKNRQTLDDFLIDPLEFAGFEREDAATAGRIRAHLKSLGTPIGPYDLLIAAQALRLGATLVTANTREFIRVPDLALEDWTAKAADA